MEFEVSIFDSNQFEREYEQTPEGVNEAGEEMNHNCKFTSQDLRANASNASLQPEGKKPNLDAKRVSSRRKEANVLASTSANADSQFVTIIKPYAVIRALVYLPSAFARPNGLMRRCKMILRDEKQRSWSVQLGPVGPRFGITRGWRQFREANAVQVGDTYKFELIDNGTIPVAYFCCEFMFTSLSFHSIPPTYTRFIFFFFATKAIRKW
ncbi:putative B3 domain-containing protein REM15 [Capsicum annuum]